PICSATEKRLDLVKAVQPEAVVYVPMGRLAKGKGVAWLKEHNAPLFCPFPMLKTREDWLKESNGQTGGALTARVVLAELDGGICPFAISTENKRNDLYFFDTEDERVESFVANVKNYLGLRKKANKDKKVVIMYFKGAGKTALHATGLEVAPSLYNLLKRLQKEGYKVDNLPTTFEDFENKVKFQGKFFNNSSQGAIDDYLANANPLWISKKAYEKWVQQQIVPKKYKEVVAEYGAFPGSYMNKGDSLAVAYLQFGNIVLMPQPRPAFESDEFKMTHGVDVPPPHSYIAPYLWAQQEFKADALLHFGTHGNLEKYIVTCTAQCHNQTVDIRPRPLQRRNISRTKCNTRCIFFVDFFGFQIRNKVF
ncbi:MAG: cobaltochelatase subunit CobN, partial [Flavobacteriaceae bacterium]|nr:cobaltochelatase subunit CobN [Flavobacteriaceae bacterium]